MYAVRTRAYTFPLMPVFGPEPEKNPVELPPQTHGPDPRPFNWRFFSLNVTSSDPNADQVHIISAGYEVSGGVSYSLCLYDVACGAKEDIVDKVLVYKDANTAEYDPQTHVHTHMSRVKYHCGPGSAMISHPSGGNISDLEISCFWDDQLQRVRIISTYLPA